MKKILAAVAVSAVFCAGAQVSGAGAKKAGTNLGKPEQGVEVPADDDGNLAAAEENSQQEEEVADGGESEGGQDIGRAEREPAAVPPKKRPKKYDFDGADDPDFSEKTKKAIRFGIDTEIAELIDGLQKDDDNRFAGELYDLFYVTKSVSVREKILSYFTKLKDPCLEDYAVEILNDPFDTKESTVNLVFDYVSAVKCTAAAPAVRAFIEDESEQYLARSLRVMGDIGSDSDAVFLAEFMEQGDLPVPQRQELVRSLGKLKAADTYDSLVSFAEDKDENSFVRQYAAEAIGSMGDQKAVPVLARLFEDPDPALRVHVIKGLSYFSTSESDGVIVQGIRDSHYSVRLESIETAKKLKLKDAVPFIIHRAQNDSNNSVKEAAYKAIAELNTSEGNEYLVKRLSDEKEKNDTAKYKIAAALLESGNAGAKEVAALAEKVSADDARKRLRYDLGKLMAKYESPEFAGPCLKYLASKDVPTQGTGLDIYAKNKFPSVKDKVQEIADEQKQSANKKKARKILGLKEEQDG